MIYLELFWSFFQIGAFSFGGSMAAIPLIQAQVVDYHGWLTLTEFTDLITIAQMIPGPITITSATFIGLQIVGYSGAFIAVLGCVLPSTIIVLTFAWLYSKYHEIFILQGLLQGLRPAIIALIASAGVSILALACYGELGFTAFTEDLNYISFALFAVSLFILRRFKKIGHIKVMLGSGVIGGILFLALDMV